MQAVAVAMPHAFGQFDRTTLSRGAAYSSGGAVVHHEYEAVGDVVYGEVQGGDRYRVEVAIERAASGQPIGFEGDCGCPVGFNCEHVVAVLLDSRGDWEPAPRAATPSAARKAAWEKPLGKLMEELEAGPTTEPLAAIQFELAPRPGRQQGDPGIQIRPVLRGARGWVRKGISWSKIEHPHLPAEARAVLREILSLHTLTGGYYRYYSYSSREAQVWLDDISSRRVWDLLANAVEVGLPLVSKGPVILHRQAVAGADLVEEGGVLRMAPTVQADRVAVPIHDAIFVGNPPHGVAWSSGSGLELAPFSRPLGKGERSFIKGPPLEVPRRDQDRFLRDFYPRLARAVEVISSDGSVELPELSCPVLVLRVRHAEARSVVRWQRGLDGADQREDLKEADRDLEAPVAAVVEIARAMPAMVERTWHGERLAASTELSGMDAVRFVTEMLPAFAEVPGLVIESEGEVPDYREAEGAPEVSLRPVGSAVGSDGDWFDLLVDVTVDGEAVPFHDLFVALAEGRSHLVLPSGTYFPLDRPELAELAELIAEARAMQDRDSPDPDLLRLSRFQAGVWEDLRRLGVRTEQAAAWETAVRALAEAADRAEAGDLTVAEPPASMDATLRPYQQEGFAWLDFLYRHRLGGILADDMGLGKTLQALSLVCQARQNGVNGPFLVVAPTSVVENWASECRRFAPDLRSVTIGETAARRWVSLADMAEKADVVVTSYNLFRLESEDYERVCWAGVFIDEAQFVKNPRSIANRKLQALPAPFKLALTGTPIENNLRELWALLALTAPGLFPRWERFAEHFAVPIERHGDRDRLAQLRRRIRPLMLRRTKEKVESELPEKQEQVLELELAPKHRRRYQLHLQRERQKILGLIGDVDRHRIEILRSLTVLRQAALDVALVEEPAGVPSTKLDALMEMLEEIASDGHRVLVFSQFTRFLSAAAERARAAGIEHCYLDGRTRRREKVIAEFKQGVAPVFFISLKAGGFGLNLTEADYCIVLDPWWNPATEVQAVDRAHRIGQTRKVLVYRLVSKGTVEEKVMALKAKKAALFSSVMASGEFDTVALSAADIRALVA